MLCFFPLDVLDEIWDFIELASEGFPTYFFINISMIIVSKHRSELRLKAISRSLKWLLFSFFQTCDMFLNNLILRFWFKQYFVQIIYTS